MKDCAQTIVQKQLSNDNHMQDSAKSPIPWKFSSWQLTSDLLFATINPKWLVSHSSQYDLVLQDYVLANYV
jgi:hypothetical protein